MGGLTDADKLFLWNKFLKLGGDKILFDRMIKNNSLEQLLDLLNEVRGNSFDGAGKPARNEIYWFIDSDGELIDEYWREDRTDLDRLEMGNVYDSKDKASGMQELRKHVVKMNKRYGLHVDKTYILVIDYKNRPYWDLLPTEPWLTYWRYDEPTVIHQFSTEQEREYRYLLIKKVYDNKINLRNS